MGENDYVTYGGIKFQTKDIKNFEKIKIREYHKREDIYVVTLNNGVKIYANDTAIPANNASGASVFLNDDRSVTLHNLLFSNITGVEGSQDVFRIYGKDTMRNTFNLGKNTQNTDNDRIIVGEEISGERFSKLNKVYLNAGDRIDFENNTQNLYSYEYDGK